MPREVFIAGQILTAAEMNTVSDQTVMSFAGTAARGSAIPSPVEGMVSYLNDADRLEVYSNAWKPVGSVLQVVSTAKTDTFSAAIADGAFSSNVTGLEATITPSSTSSKVLVTVAITIARSDARPIGFMRLMRGATAVGIADADASRPRLSHGFFSADSLGLNMSQNTFQFLDSPATTSATTYGVQLYGLGPFTFLVNRSQDDTNGTTGHRTVSTITVMEVAG
jgi:hypothetical protein